MKVNDIARKHVSWLEKMHWNSGTALEHAAILGGEIGKLASQIEYGGIAELFPEELSDLLLCSAGIAYRNGFDIDGEVSKIEAEPVAYKSVERCLHELMSCYSRYVTGLRYENPVVSGEELVSIVAKTLELATRSGVDLEAAVSAKMEMNEMRSING